MGRVRKVQMGQEPLRQREAQEVQDVGHLGKRPGAEPQGPGPIPPSEICGDLRPSSQAACALNRKLRSVSTVPSPSTDTSAKNPCYPGSRQAWFCSQAWPLAPAPSFRSTKMTVSRSYHVQGPCQFTPFPENPLPFPREQGRLCRGPPLTAAHWMGVQIQECLP